MIFVDKTSTPIPASLNSAATNAVFNAVISKKIYDNQHDEYYKADDIKNALATLYHKKCAFCEKSLVDTRRAIEHFRPKKKDRRTLRECDGSFGYYWLAFSWENLLLACTECNTAKTTCFNIQGTRASHAGEFLPQLHLTRTYLALENPLLFNPEQENPASYLSFTNTGRITAVHRRLSHTITICQLNRDELTELRRTWLTDFMEELDANFNLLNANRKLEFQDRLDYMVKDVQKILNKVTFETQFLHGRST